MDINEILRTLLAILLPPLVALGIDYLRRRIGLEKLQQIKAELENNQAWAILAVRYAEQVFWDKTGAEKYDMACQWLSNRAKEKNLNITADEIKGLIESSVQILKTELGELWEVSE